MMAVPSPASNQKWRASLGKSSRKHAKIHAISIFFAAALGATTITPNPDEPTEDSDPEGDELGVNPYTPPSIEKIFAQLDQLGALPFDQLKPEPPKSTPTNGERKGL